MKHYTTRNYISGINFCPFFNKYLGKLDCNNTIRNDVLSG